MKKFVITLILLLSFTGVVFAQDNKPVLSNQETLCETLGSLVYKYAYQRDTGISLQDAQRAYRYSEMVIYKNNKPMETLSWKLLHLVYQKSDINREDFAVAVYQLCMKNSFTFN